MRGGAHIEVIALFSDVTGPAAAGERDYLATGNFPHTTKLKLPPKDA